MNLWSTSPARGYTTVNGGHSRKDWTRVSIRLQGQFDWKDGGILGDDSCIGVREGSIGELILRLSARERIRRDPWLLCCDVCAEFR